MDRAPADRRFTANCADPRCRLRVDPGETFCRACLDRQYAPEAAGARLAGRLGSVTIEHAVDAPAPPIDGTARGRIAHCPTCNCLWNAAVLGEACPHCAIR